MSKTLEPSKAEPDEMREEYDFSQMTGLVRGKHHEQYKKGINVVLLASDSAQSSPNSKAVNAALRKSMRQNAKSQKQQRITMAWDENLTGTARNIAACKKSPLRVLAGPGTGKTFVLMRRVARLLENNAKPKRILVCTFTRTAATDLKNSILELGVEGAEKVNAQTLHSFCFGLLAKADVPAVMGRVPRPLLDFEVRFLLEDLKEAGMGSVRDCKRQIEAFNASWARLQSQEPGWPKDLIDRERHNILIAWLKFHQAMLIGELIPMALHFLRENPASEFRGSFDHVLVDEYQDLNKAEQVLLDVLAEAGTLTVVGDEDQSIYSFRYAHPEGIVQFETTHPGTHDESLEICRRCPSNIVEMANCLIANNTARTPRELIPVNADSKAEAHVVQWRTMDEEVDGITEFIHNRVSSGEVRPGQVLILTQRRKIGYAIRAALSKLGTATHSFFQEQELDGAPKKLSDCKAQCSFTLLTLLANPEDRVALRCWCGFGNSSLGSKAWVRLRSYCETSGDSPRVALEKLLDGQIKIPYTSVIVERYKELKTLLESLQGLLGNDLIDALFPADEAWTDAFRTIASFAALMEEGDFNGPKLLKVLRERVTQPETPTDVDYVRIMSLHKSKGLISEMVVVVGCVEGLIPQIDDEAPLEQQARQYEEQRRLFYVALTRASKTLVISSVTQIDKKLALTMGVKPKSYAGNAVRTITSPFIRELGPACPHPLGKEGFETAVKSAHTEVVSHIAETRLLQDQITHQPVFLRSSDRTSEELEGEES